MLIGIESKLEGDSATNIEDEVREGHRFMRFATAAYGVELSLKFRQRLKVVISKSFSLYQSVHLT